MRASICAALLALGLAAPPVVAQAQRVTVSGRVIDAATGHPLAGADVRLAGRDTVRASTSEHGEWRALAHPGTYTMHVRMLGHRAASVEARVSDGGGPIVVALMPLPLSLDQVVVTAARREQRLADVVVTTELLTAADIARTGASDLGGALSAQTGIELSGGHPAGVGAMLQGLGSERVLVLLDGQPLPGRISGEFDVSRMPTSIIERVEIVKGPQSTLYGTDAMGGVINIITRGADAGQSFMSANLIAGSRNRLDGSVAAGGSLGDVAVRAEAGRRFIETAPGRADERGALAQRLDGAVNLQWAASDATTVEASVLALDERQRWLGGTLYNFGDNTQVSGRVQAERVVGDTRLRTTLYASVYDHLSRASSQPAPIRGDTGQRQVQRLFQGELAYTMPLGRHLLDLGAQARVDDTRSVRIPGGRRSITTVEPMAQLEANLTPATAIVAGTRVSHSQRWGTHVTPRLALRQRLGAGMTLRASAGTGFRAPDFRELYMRFQNQSVGYAVQGNEDLRPETSRNATVGAEWVADRGYGRAQLFWNEFRGFIETRVISDPDAPPVFEYANVDNGFTRGLELEGATNVGALRLDAGYAFLSTGDRESGRPLLGRPAHSARASLASPLLWGVRASASAVYTGRTPMQRDSAGNVSSWRDAYPRMDLRLARALTRDVELSLSVDNVLDHRPAEWAGFTGRQLFAALRWNGER